MAHSNDVQGLIWTALSAAACMVGSCFICIDFVVKHFARSLALSSGVMLFSSLYKLLPSSQASLLEGGLSAKSASSILVGLFLVGAIGIQALSQLLHHMIPHHVVSCHDGDDHPEEEGEVEEESGHVPPEVVTRPEPVPDSPPVVTRPPLYAPRRANRQSHGSHLYQRPKLRDAVRKSRSSLDLNNPRRGSFSSAWSKIILPSANAPHCGQSDCHGFSRPCGACCKRHDGVGVPSKLSIASFLSQDSPTDEGGALEQGHGLRRTPVHANERTSLLQANGLGRPCLADRASPTAVDTESSDSTNQQHHQGEETDRSSHHHHVPENSFLSVGLQTSLAIALHKIPEGFITYATNHANPQLGVSVFVSLFVHNISEGFALAFPLCLALRSRTKAIAWTALLGGASQPLGAGIAWFWFYLAGSSSAAPGPVVYGCMFALVAGIMTSVGLQLLSEGLQQSRENGASCVSFAILGMGLLGVSSALIAS